MIYKIDIKNNTINNPHKPTKIGSIMGDLLNIYISYRAF